MTVPGETDPHRRPGARSRGPVARLADAALRARRAGIRARWYARIGLGIPVPYLPSSPRSWSYAHSHHTSEVSAGVPVPPAELWAGYGETAEQYLASGKRDVASLRAALAALADPWPVGAPVLDFGCHAGRMTRWLPDLVAGDAEIWGVDIDAGVIRWCEQHLSPPSNFAVTTVVPHLPFPDGYFGLVICGSVFTHIDDLAMAWILELRRVTRPGGVLYATIHDEHSTRLLAGTYADSWLGEYTRSRPEYGRYVAGCWDEFSLGRFVDSQVFYSTDAFRRRLEKGFVVHRVIREGYGYQTSLLTTRR